MESFRYIDRFVKEQQQMVSRLNLSHGDYLAAIKSMKPAIDILDSIKERTAAFESMVSANSAIQHILEQQRDISRFAEEMARQAHSAWEPQAEVFRYIANPVKSMQLALESHYSRLAETSLAAERMLAWVSSDRIGAALTIDAVERDLLKEPFFGLSAAYKNLFESLLDSRLGAALLPSVATGFPPLEVYTAADLLTVVSESGREFSEDEVSFRKELSNEREASLEQLLAAINPNFVILWRGASQALYSDNPDRFRHVVVSLRELLTHVIHAIAPDDKVHGWTTNPHDFENGRPTRAARILFICRGINHGPFTEFVSRDVASATSFLQLFQRGTHELNVGFSEEQVTSLIWRAESLIRFLILTARSTQ
jgi:hypothetical protein